MRTLTQEDLNQTGCSEPGCVDDHSVLFIHASGHRRAGVEACYRKASGVMEFRCQKCAAMVVEIQVARRTVQ